MLLSGAVLAVGLVAQAMNASNDCVRPLGGVHVAATVGGAVSELERQRECLVLEGSADPKAELLPPSKRRSAERIVRIGPLPPERSAGAGSRTMTWDETWSQGGFRLGDPKVILAPR